VNPRPDSSYEYEFFSYHVFTAAGQGQSIEFNILLVPCVKLGTNTDRLEWLRAPIYKARIKRINIGLLKEERKGSVTKVVIDIYLIISFVYKGISSDMESKT
jgi:hypothetical protein